MSKYEITVLSKGAEGVEEKIEKLVKAMGGKVMKAQSMGKKQLAYEISGQNSAEYTNFQVELPGASVAQLEVKLNIEEQKGELLRHLLIKVEDTKKKK